MRWIVSDVRHGMIKPIVIVIPMRWAILSDLDIVIKLSVIVLLLRIYYPVTIVLSIEKDCVVWNELKGETIKGKYPEKGQPRWKKRGFTEKKKEKK